MRTLFAGIMGVVLAPLAIALLAAHPARADDVTGLNIRSVTYSGGDYTGTVVNVGGKTWIEQNTHDGPFTFQESQRIPTGVYLFDASRNTELEIDLYTHKIFYKIPPSQDWQPLYDIVAASTSPTGGSSTQTTIGSGGGTQTTTGSGTTAGSPFSAPAGFVWSYAKHSSNKTGTQITMAFGAPNSDAQQLQARCAVGAHGPFAVITLGADVGSLPDGSDVQLAFKNGGYSATYDATVTGTTAQEGITGVTFSTDLLDDIWKQFERRNSFSYLVAGYGTQQLSLRGGSSVISKFVTACSTIPDTGVGQSTGSSGSGSGSNAIVGGTATNGRVVSCSSFPGLVTLPGGAPSTVTFINESPGYRSTMWLNEKGEPVHYSDLQQGESTVQQTYANSPWMITDGPGNCTEIFIPNAGKSTFHIKAAGAGEGD